MKIGFLSRMVRSRRDDLDIVKLAKFAKYRTGKVDFFFIRTSFLILIDSCEMQIKVRSSNEIV